MRRCLGQSLVETIAVAPLMLLCGVLALQALAAGATHVFADNAAHAGALAAELGSDPVASARRALPGWARGRVSVVRRADAIDVEVAPRAVVPGLAALLRSRAHAAFSGGAR